MWRSKRGFALLELISSICIFSIVIVMFITFFRSERKAINRKVLLIEDSISINSIYNIFSVSPINFLDNVREKYKIDISNNSFEYSSFTYYVEFYDNKIIVTIYKGDVKVEIWERRKI